MSRQYCACKFRSSDSRSYTYHWDGQPLAVGDTVKVEDARSDGWKRVEVVSISDTPPSFPTKPILGKVEPEASADASDPLSDEIAF